MSLKSNKAKVFISLQKRGPCEICKGQYNTWQMQFDHIDHRSKKIEVSKCRSISRAKKEIAKCRLVCANCHADITYKNKNIYGVVKRLSEELEFSFMDDKS
jgi:hypothetical protein